MPTMTTLVDGTIPVANDFNGNYSALNNAIGTGTTIAAWATGDIPYASGTNTLSRLAVGNTGQVLTVVAGLPAWSAVSSGAWTTVTYNSANFTANVGNWTVDSGDGAYAYVQNGKTMFVVFEFATTSVSSASATLLKIKIPNSATSAKTTRSVVEVQDNGGSVVSGVAVVSAAGTNIEISNGLTYAGTNWAVSTNTTGAWGQIFFEIQ
jgi:hypothetical protein